MLAGEPGDGHAGQVCPCCSSPPREYMQGNSGKVAESRIPGNYAPTIQVNPNYRIKYSEGGHSRCKMEVKPAFDRGVRVCQFGGVGARESRPRQQPLFPLFPSG